MTVPGGGRGAVSPIRSPVTAGSPERTVMTRTSLPDRRNRWRSAAAGLAITAASFTVAACGEEEPVDQGGVVEEEDSLDEDD